MLARLSLVASLSSVVALASATATASPPEAPPVNDEAVARGFVLAANLGLVAFPALLPPSGEFSLLLAGALPVRLRRPGHWVALGYRGTVGGGYADVPASLGFLRPMAHRHHVAVQGVAGRRSRLAYGASLGFAGFAGGPNIAGGELAFEGEGRLGYVYGSNPGVAQGVLGVQVRRSAPIWRIASVPLPTFGLVIGVQFGRRLPAPRG